MSGTSRLKAYVASLTTFGLATVGLSLVAVPTAAADPAPIVQPPATTVTADRLPTVQMDGVAWSQTVVGNTVYVAGRFNNARPAGAAAGTNLTPRANLLAYDIATGNLITSWAPSLNAQALSITASPDGSRIYVAGDFSTANGQARRRVAAFFPVGHAQAGQLITAFNPSGPNSQARSVIATNSTVYVGGGFLGLQNGTLRNNLVAYSTSGGVLPWNPSATGTAGDASAAVWALAKTDDGATIFAGGQFQNIGGQPAYGLAKLSAGGTGVLDTTWRPSVRSAGADAGIHSLVVQNNHVYGTGWHFGPGGNLEGVFKSPVDGATDPTDIVWVTDCHGDFYSSFLTNGIVYSVGHSHYCGNMGGGFPQYSTWKFQHAQAWSDTQTGDILNDVHGYPNWHGVEPGPANAHWLPDLAIGTFTGQGQAGWNVTGNSDYILYGGEFPRVNGGGQQGLVRFAKRSIAPGAEGPRFTTTPFAPTLVATSATSARVSWPAAWDRDDMTLTYKAIRTGVSTPRVTLNANSQWWNTPRLGFTDTGLTPGATYSYRIVVNDPGGNTVQGSTVSITMPASVPAASAYASAVRGAGARTYWPLNETSGTTITDRAAGATAPVGVGVNDGRSENGVTWGQPGAIAGDSAAALGDNDFARAYTLGQEYAPDTFSIQGWIKTTTTNGGRILGFSDLQNGSSGHRDRHLYMDNSGRLVFGVRAQNNATRTVASAGTFRDDQWHMVTATMGPSGMALYVDGVRVGQRADTTEGEEYVGNWRLGGDNLDGWPSRPNSRNFVGSVDEVAIYPTALTSSQIDNQYEASGRTTTVPPAPADAYGAAVYADDPDLYWRLAETSGTTANDSGRSANPGTYRNGVTLGATGALSVNPAAQFNGSDQFVASNAAFSDPSVYSTEAWFRTSTTTGGKIIGFGDNPTGSSGSYDRHVYLQDDGKLVFGAYTGQLNVVTSAAAYNDNQWHHVVATQSGNGMKLYVDGSLIGTNPQTGAQAYTGYWKIGGDNTWGSSSAYLNGSIDEVAVYSTELSAARVGAHFAAGGGTANQPPTAAFTVSESVLSVDVNGSGSSDPDGTIAGYSWNFGDGETATGATASHTYDADGTYTVTLTVTDDDGGTDTATRSVTVAAPNSPPDANFTAAVNDLALAVDAAASDDPDGTISSYAWDFGDGATGSGETDTHTYGAAGTYTVRLTVTDNDGDTDTTTRSVTATAPAVLAADAFNRSVSTGWGSADTGGAWSLVTSGSNFAVTGGAGAMRMAAGSGPAAYLNGVSARDVDLSTSFSYDKPGSGGGIYTSAIVRRIGTSDYRVKVRVTATATTLALVRTVSGTETTLSSETVSGLVVGAGDVLNVRLEATGNGTTTLRTKIWRGGTTEPGTWNLTSTDTTASLQAAGGTGIYNYLSGSATNAPITIRVADFRLVPSP